MPRTSSPKSNNSRVVSKTPSGLIEKQGNAVWGMLVLLVATKNRHDVLVSTHIPKQSLELKVLFLQFSSPLSQSASDLREGVRPLPFLFDLLHCSESRSSGKSPSATAHPLQVKQSLTFKITTFQSLPNVIEVAAIKILLQPLNRPQ